MSPVVPADRSGMGWVRTGPPRPPPRIPRGNPARTGAWFAATCALALLLASCTEPGPPPRRPEDVRAQIVRLMPATVRDRKGWAVDIYAAFASLGIEPTTQNLCATLAVAEQESNFTVDPAVPNLPAIARAEIERRAQQHDIPLFLVHAALRMDSPDGRSYDERLAAVRTEQDMSRIYEDFIGSVPLGRKLFANDNPVRTGGPMQVGVAFAESEAHARSYPYAAKPAIRHEVFTRRGGVYFGIAHLLGYPASYPRMIYRFADYNAGLYASRNAAFQQAVALASGIPIPLDGDLVRYDSKQAGTTELAVRSLAPSLGQSPAEIHRALEKGEDAGFEKTALYRQVFDLAERMQRKALPRAMLPRIALESPKITRKLSTEWFAKRVDERFQRCMAKSGG